MNPLLTFARRHAALCSPEDTGRHRVPREASGDSREESIDPSLDSTTAKAGGQTTRQDALRDGSIQSAFMEQLQPSSPAWVGTVAPYVLKQREMDLVLASFYNVRHALDQAKLLYSVADPVTRKLFAEDVAEVSLIVTSWACVLKTSPAGNSRTEVSGAVVHSFRTQLELAHRAVLRLKSLREQHTGEGSGYPARNRVRVHFLLEQARKVICKLQKRVEERWLAGASEATSSEDPERDAT